MRRLKNAYLKTVSFKTQFLQFFRLTNCPFVTKDLLKNLASKKNYRTRKQITWKLLSTQITKKTFLGAFQKTRSNSKKVNMEDIIDIHFGELSSLR